MAKIYTVGHGTRSLDDLVAILRAAEVSRLVDVRRFPGSRRHPQFAGDHLERTLPQRGLTYDFRGDDLGGRRRIDREARSRHTAWRNPSFRAYADHMDTHAFRKALARLEEDAEHEQIAMMCAETAWWRCHRRMIADALILRGHEVVHLLGEKRREPHSLHENVRADEEGWPVYDSGHAQLPLI